MASYDELYAMIMKESVKTVIGRTGIAAAKAAGLKKDENKADDEKEKRSKINEKIDNHPKIKKAAEIVGGAISAPIEKSSQEIAKKIVDNKEKKLKLEYADNPEQLEKKLKENILRLDKLEQNIMTGEIAVLSAATIGPVQWILTGVLTAAGIAKGNAKLCSAIVASATWAIPAMKKLNEITGGKIEKTKAVSSMKSIVSKILGTLENWAKSDEPLIKNSSVTESVMDMVYEELLCEICDSVINESVSINEALYLLESSGFKIVCFE